LIALPAMRAMALLNSHGMKDKSGGKKGFFEVYPKANLLSCGLHGHGYKKTYILDTRK